MTGTVRLELVDHVARLTIDRPDKRNAMSWHLWRELGDHLATIRASPEVSLVVLAGTPGAFSAGMDLDEMRSIDPAEVERLGAIGIDTVRALEDLPQATVAAIDGVCFGAGFGLALACDMRLASGAASFGIPALRNGLVYDPRLTCRLVRVVGSGAAGLLLLGGERWDAREATTQNLVDRMTDDLERDVAAIAATTGGASHTAVLATVAALRAA